MSVSAFQAVSDLTTKTNIIEENVDLLVIILIGVLLIIVGIIGAVLFIITLRSAQDPHILYPFIYTLIPVSMIANSGWALIPSMLSSRFRAGLRNTCSTLVYNGALVIGFASPFIMLELYLSSKGEYVIFFPMILGAFAMIRGAAHFINDRNTLADRIRVIFQRGDD
jgi:hypothetical protein